MKNFFSLKLYIEGLRKIRVAGVASAVTVVALNAILPIIGLLESRRAYLDTRTPSVVPSVGFAPFGLLMMAFALVLTYSMFSYLNERSKSDFWHAVPEKRICVYFSFTAAIYTWIAGTLLVSGLVNLLLWNLAEYYVAGFGSFLGSFGLYFLAAVMLVGFMSLAMTLTGTTVSNVLIFALLFLFVRAVGGIFTMCLGEVIPMFDPFYSVLRVFDIEFFLPFSLIADLYSVGRGTTFTDLPLILYSVACALLLLGLGAIGYVRRKSEAATHSAPSRRLQHIYRCAITLPFCLLLVYFMIENMDFDLLVIMLVVILLVWVIFELMTTKKIKNVLKSLPVLAVPLVLSLLFTGAVYTTRNVIWNDTPDADEILGVSLESRNTYTYETVVTNGIVVEDKALNQLVADALESTVEAAKNSDRGYQYVRKGRAIVIRLKSGRTMGRYVSLDDKEYQRLTEGFYESDAYLDAYMSMPLSRQIDTVHFSHFSLSERESRVLWNLFLEEYNGLSDEEKLALKNYNSYKNGTLPIYSSKGEAVGHVYLNGQLGIQRYSAQYPVLFEYTPRTAERYLEYRNEAEGLSGYTATESLPLAREILRNAAEEGEYLSGSIGIDVLRGDVPTGYFYLSDKEMSQAAFLPLVDFLVSAEDIDNYKPESGKSIFLLSLVIETNVSWQEDPHISFEGKEIVTRDYTYLQIPIALTAKETEQFGLLMDSVKEISEWK